MPTIPQKAGAVLRIGLSVRPPRSPGVTKDRMACGWRLPSHSVERETGAGLRRCTDRALRPGLARRWCVLGAGQGGRPVLEAAIAVVRRIRATAMIQVFSSAITRATIAARVRTPSLTKIRRRYDETVHSLRRSRAAICLFPSPLLTSAATCSSRCVKWSRTVEVFAGTDCGDPVSPRMR